MKLSQMLDLYRGAATPQMKEIAVEFNFLSASEQRELLFWMVVDASTNPTKVQHVERKPS
jgi:hypothetical protein